MEGQESDQLRRSTRRTVRNRYRVPNAEHYVGYVADDETPEMIMKRFEKLEEAMQHQPPSAPDPSTGPPVTTSNDEAQASEEPSDSLTEDQLKRMVEASNAFSVREAFQTDLDLVDDLEITDVDSSDVDFELSGEESGSDMGEEKKAFTRTKRNDAAGEKLERSGAGSTIPRLFLHGKPHPAATRGKKSHSRGQIQLRIPPPPLPPSWGRTVQPYRAPSSAEDHLHSSERLEVPTLGASELRQALEGRRFLGVMINPSWFTDSPLSVLRLKRLELNQICPEGFMFVWIPKAALQSVWRILKSWGFVYVENLTWVQLQPNNKVRCDAVEAPALLPCSHWTLYIFRRRGKDIEIKHQRSSDVVMDVRASFDVFQPPREVYNAIETMLPTARGKLLELWSAPGAARAGWMHVFETNPVKLELGDM